MARNPLCLILLLALAGCGGVDPAPGADSATPVASPAAPSPAASAAATPVSVDYVAGGNEPFWNVATEGTRMVYSSPEQLDGVSLAATVSSDAGWTKFAATMDGAPLVLEVRKAPCSDDMSGFAYSHEARLTRSDGTWNGCARLTTEPQPHE